MAVVSASYWFIIFIDPSSFVVGVGRGIGAASSCVDSDVDDDAVDDNDVVVVNLFRVRREFVPVPN